MVLCSIFRLSEFPKWLVWDAQSHAHLQNPPCMQEEKAKPAKGKILRGSLTHASPFLTLFLYPLYLYMCVGHKHMYVWLCEWYMFRKMYGYVNVVYQHMYV